ncbi:BspA family leucine-rich repeat surface protein [Listeria monocytogenes]|nr:BspA family leucine-rich repeat surface protein [Listeria monocytogenes]ECZ8708268.1 BspA family leucine-rich repeat surface protein [Listeria monocytogenes]EHE1139544.1 BspA family leucine-rich repeat surface protein [Listeria monocytogenes]EHO7443052.1 BspA family leucine-rich repeat surface protein [Listeria monocytogenes]EHO9271302.1 BspA family leucine-rich repeat surface protein [Listeria monocytogenes]
MKKRKKRLRQLVLAFLILNMIGLPIQNIVFANEIEQTINEAVLLEETEAKESETVETNTSDSNNMESETAPIFEKESEPTEISSSETVLEKSKVLTDTPTFNSSEKQKFSEEASSTTKQSEKRPATKNVTSGGFPNGSTATWKFDDTTGTLSITGGTLINPAESIQDLTGIPVSEITNILFEDKLFLSGNCSALFHQSIAPNLDVGKLDTSEVTDMSNMFRESAATSLDLSGFDTSKVTRMAVMFYRSAATSLDLSNWNTSNLVYMQSMFRESAVTSLDVSNFDTSNVISMQTVFLGASTTSLDLSGWDTSNVTDMVAMFQNSSVTSLDVSNFDTSNVTNMLNMFAGASQLQNLALGGKFRFLSNAGLPNPTPGIKYTGRWQNVGSGTVNNPKGMFINISSVLMGTYDGSTMADTYVWQPILLEVNVQDSVLMVGDTWNPADNFVSGLDSVGNPVDFNAITVTGSVDTTQPGVHSVDYSYGGRTSTATITVLETMPASWINFSVDGTNVRSIPGSLLSKPEWDLTTGLWDKWNPGTVKVPADKLPSEPTKQGYEFKGWKDNTGTMVDFSILDLDLNNQNEFDFYAAFEKKEYTVTFDVEGKQEQQAVLFEELITEPTVPYKAGYAFTGWYDAESGGNRWDFTTDTMPAKEITLYAQFNKLGFVTPEIKPSIPTIITPIMPGVDPITPNIEPPTTPGEGPNTVSNTGSRNTIITSPKNTTTFSLATPQESKLAKLGEKNSLILQGLGLIMMISGIVFFIFKRKKICS